MANFNAGAIEATLELDRSPFQRGIELARAQARNFARQRFAATLDVDTAAANAKIAALEARLAVLGSQDPTVDIDLDTAAAHAQILALQAQLAALAAQDVDIDVDVSSFGAARAGAMGLVSAGLLIGPALIPGITGATAVLGGLVSMLATAGAGVAILGAGLIGNITRITGAQKSLTAAQDASTAAAAQLAAAQDGVKSALQGVGDAERNLASARRNAAYSTAQAEQQLRDAHEAARRAQLELNEARREAVDRLSDMRDQLRGAALDEEGSELAVREARLRLQAVMADPASTMLEQQQAQLAYDRALYQMDQARKTHDELQTSVKKANKAGVEGDAQVVAAKARVRDANDGVKAAEQNLSRTRADGARAVADAQRGLARAHDQVAQAQAGAAAASAALAEANKALAESQSKLDGPAAFFVAALEDAKEAWGEFLDLTGKSTVGKNGVATVFLELFTKYMPQLAPVVDAIAGAVVKLLRSFEKWADSGGLQTFIDFMVKYGPDMVEGIGKSIGNLVLGISGIVEAFAPFALQMLGPDGMFAGFAKWGEKLDKSEGFKGFMAYVQETGPLFLEVLGAAWDALVNIGKALAPAAVPVLTVLKTVFETLADMDPVVLGMVGGAIAMIAGGLMIYTGGAPIVGAVLALAGASILISNLAKDTGWFGQKFDELWNDILKPGFAGITKALEKDLFPALAQLKPILEPVVKFIGGVLVYTFMAAWDAILDIVEGAIKLISGAINFWIGLFTGDWDKMWKGIKQSASGAWDVVKGIFKGAFGGIGAIIRAGVEAIGGDWGQIQRVFATPVNWIIRNVLNKLIDAVNWVSNKLGGSDIFDHVGEISFAGTYSSAAGAGGKNAGGQGSPRGPREVGAANGAVLPGYMPGVDTLHYKSPRGPDLHLSGGEAIMVPEWTRAVGGPAAVKQMNAAARYGRYATGGVWPATGDVTQHPVSQYPWARWSGDINVPGDETGNPVSAWKAGVVAAVQHLTTSYGNHVRINHPSSNEQTLYAHLSRTLVNPGDSVAAGQMIGRVGDTGNASGPHLHFEIKGGQGAIDMGTGGDGGWGFNPLKLLGGIKGAFSQIGDVLNGGGIPGGAFGAELAGGVLSTGRDLIGDWIKDKIPGASLFDRGGKIMPGYTNVLNLTKKPEALLTDEQWQLAKIGLGVTEAGSRDGWTREDIERLIDAVRAANPIVVPGGDDAAAIVDALGFELRVQDRGGVSRL